MEIIIKKFYELTLDELYAILKARSDIFVVEQNCVYPDVDNKDQNAYHVMLKVDKKLVAYCRVFEENHVIIGRVISVIRGKGYGYEVMKVGIDVVNKHFNGKTIFIEAQLYAKGFYEKLGFKQVSKPFLLDGIEHIEMILENKR